MKYMPEERMDIGRRIYDGELSCRTAAEIYGINKHTAKRYLWLYRDTLGLSPKVGRPESLSRAVAKKTSSLEEGAGASRGLFYKGPDPILRAPPS